MEELHARIEDVIIAASSLIPSGILQIEAECLRSQVTQLYEDMEALESGTRKSIIESQHRQDTLRTEIHHIELCLRERSEGGISDSSPSRRVTELEGLRNKLRGQIAELRLLRKSTEATPVVSSL